MKSSSEIEEICREYNIINYTINEDGSIDVDGNVNLYRKLTKLPLNFNKVTGYFNCGYNELTTLKGSPKYVGGDFNCESNKLTSLEFGPIEVGSNFYCGYNKLTSLEFSPKKVGVHFTCNNNQLTSLEFSPIEVGSNFYCGYNKLTSLEHGPKKVGRDFSCTNNKLTSLEFSPKEVGDSFICTNNPKLTNLYGISDNINGFLYCYDTPLGSIFNDVGIDFIRAFNIYRVIKDDKVILKRLKYVMDLFDMRYDLNKIKKHYEIN